MKETAVEWLVDELILEGFNVPKVFYDKAKKMEREQIIEAYKYGNQSDVYFKPEQYYNETFNNESKNKN
jgi:hypothetical protein